MSEIVHIIDEDIDKGLYPSLPGRKGIVWRDGRNITFMEASVQAGLGQFGYFYTETTEVITGVRETQSPLGGTVTYYGTPTALKRYDGTVENRSKVGGYNSDESDLWQFARWGNWMVATNGVDPIQVDKNDGNGFQDLTGTPFTYAKCIGATDTHLIAANTSLGGAWVGWTDLDDIEEWTPAADNDAGSKELRNSDSDVISLKKRGDGFSLHTYNEMYIMEYIGSPFVFSIREGLTGFGAVGKHAASTIGRRNFGFGRRGLWITDGTSHEFIDIPKLNDFIFGASEYAFDQTKGDKVLAWHDQLQTSFVFYYSTKDSDHNNIGVSYNYKSGAVSIYNYGRTAVDDSGILRFALTGDAAGNIYLQSATATPPAAGSHGTVLVDDVEFSITAGYGELGYGELGYGGSIDGTG